jgi:hypothetical protein
MRLLTISLCVGSLAWAQVPPVEDEPTHSSAVPEAGAPIPDAVFRALGERQVLLRMRDGGMLCGNLLGFDASTVTLAMVPSLSVAAVPRGEIVEVRLAPPLTMAPGPPPPPERERHFALALGLPPAVAIDVDYKLFYGFFNISLVFPAATGGRWVSLGTGLGVNFRLSQRSRWKMEVFGAITPLRFSENEPWVVGIGLGLGFHYTTLSGFTVGFKVPVIGYGVQVGRGNRGGENAGYYYLSSATGLPLASLGYRF